MINKYKIYCETDNKWEEVLASSEPTQCPANNAHTIRSGSASIVESDIEINDGTPTSVSLDEYKQLKNNEIDKRTQELIYTSGFSFDGQTFSMSSEAQANWIGLKSMEDLLTFPVNITTIDDNEYSLTQANLPLFCGSALSAKQSHLDSGRALKVSVNSATDEAGVDAVVDNR